MAAYQIGDYALSQAYFYLSYVQAMRGGDRVGALFASMNVSGLIYPALGLWREGLWLSERVSVEANEIATNMSAEAAKRPLRIVMNCCIHRIDIAIQLGKEPQYLEDLCQRLDANPVYFASREQEWARGAVARAREYIRSEQQLD